MGSVYWAYVEHDGEVECEEADRAALYRHQEALDALCARLGLPRMESVVDTTDLRYNLGVLEIPDDDVEAAMLAQGVWAGAADALLLLEGLHAAVDGERDLDAQARVDLRDELESLLEFARPRLVDGARFCLAVVM